MTVETKDLWLAAYLLANAGILKEINLAGAAGGGEVPVFIVEGEGMDYLAAHYADGNIPGNLARQRRSLEFLKMKTRWRMEEPHDH
jgi:hypothetical protein